MLSYLMDFSVDSDGEASLLIKKKKKKGTFGVGACLCVGREAPCSADST